MSTRTAAVVGVRIVALWLLFQATCGVVGYGLFRAGIALRSHSARRAADVAADVTVLQAWSQSVVYTTLPRFAFGVVLLITSRPVGRIIARGLE